MKRAAYTVLMALGVACVAVTGAVIWLSMTNTALQERVQRQQDTLNRGVLSQQGREISANVVRAMGAVAVTNSAMREVLRKHGYTVQGPEGTNAAAVVAPGTWQPSEVRP